MKKKEKFAIDFALWLDETHYQHPIKNNCFAPSKTAFDLQETYTVNELIKVYKKQLKSI